MYKIIMTSIIVILTVLLTGCSSSEDSIPYVPDSIYYDAESTQAYIETLNPYADDKVSSQLRPNMNYTKPDTTYDDYKDKEEELKKEEELEEESEDDEDEDEEVNPDDMVLDDMEVDPDEEVEDEDSTPQVTLFITLDNYATHLEEYYYFSDDTTPQSIIDELVLLTGWNLTTVEVLAVGNTATVSFSEESIFGTRDISFEQNEDYFISEPIHLYQAMLNSVSSTLLTNYNIDNVYFNIDGEEINFTEYKVKVPMEMPYYGFITYK